MDNLLPDHVRQLTTRCAGQPPWEISASKMITPFLPAHVPVPASLINRLGRVSVSAAGLAIDQKKVVLWQDIREIHTRPAFEVVTTSMIDKAVQRAAFVLPPVPGKRMSTELVAQKAKEALVSIMRVALSGSSPTLVFDLPTKVVHSGRGRREHEMAPGLLTLAFLTLPGVSDGLLAAAQQHHRPIVRHQATTSPTADGVAEGLRDHLRAITARMSTQPPPAEPDTPAEPLPRWARNQY